MATDFWASSHYKRWIVDRATLQQARWEDRLYVSDPIHLDFLAIFFADVISKLAKKLQFRQRVIATAVVFFRRFYLKNSYCETDPFMVLAACCYLASKAEESPVHIKSVIFEARNVFSQDYGITNFPSDTAKLAEMEFYLLDDLECDLTVFHPYRSLLAICGREGSTEMSTDAGELGVKAEDGPRYWGTGDGKLQLHQGALQIAWFIINDTYYSELCLLHPPHLMAIAALYISLVMHPDTRATLQPSSNPTSIPPTPSLNVNRRSARSSSSSQASSPSKKPPQDIIDFLAGLNVSLPTIATVVQEIITFYAVWDRYAGEGPGSPFPTGAGMLSASLVSSQPGSAVTTPATDLRGPSSAMASVLSTGVGVDGGPMSSIFLTQLVVRMRERKQTDMLHPPTGRPVAVNKMLERAQAAG